MVTESVPVGDATAVEPRASWMPLVVIAATQILMVFNVSTLQVSIEAISSSFDVPATSIATAIVTYALVVAGSILLAARIVEIYGSRLVFRTGVALFGAAMAVMAVSPGMAIAVIAQVVAGAAAALLVPTLVVLIAENYRGAQQAKALAWLAGSAAMGIVLAFLIAALLAGWIGWRFTFGLLVLLAAGLYLSSDRFAPPTRRSGVSIDALGAVLAAAAIFLISLGANNLTDWGALLAGPGAPFAILDMSPAPIMMLTGIFLGQAFVSWSRRRAIVGKRPLVALEVIDTREERAALFSIFAISAFASAITFLIPLYIQVVQGRSSLETAAAVVPFSIASFAAAVLVVRLLDRMSPRATARYAFLAVAAGVMLLGTVIRNDWSDAAVILGMVVIGLGEGALVTLLFNVLVTASPQALAGDVGSLRGTINNLATGVGTAVASTLVVALLGSTVHRELVHNDVIPLALKTEINLDRVAFVSNEQLRSRLALTAAIPEQVAEAERINTDARLLALKVTFYGLAGLALLAYFPAGALPGRVRVAAEGGEDTARRRAGRESPAGSAPAGDAAA
ncbi:MAG TPA: MFS transporter [Gammaproteobacteria bacterium]